jgi:hypothetical protein
MCNYQEWERLARQFQKAGVESGLREFVADAITCIEEFAEDLKSRACAPEHEEWIRGHRRRSRTEWVA